MTQSPATPYLWQYAKRNALARLTLAQRAAIARSEAEKTLAWLRTKKDWDEADHPRDEDGKFSDGGGGGGGGSAKPSGATSSESEKPPQQELWPDKFPPIPEPKAKIDVTEFEKDGVTVVTDGSGGGKIAPGGKAAKDFEKVWNDQVGSIDPGEFKEKFLGGVKGTMGITHHYRENEDGEIYANSLTVSGKLHSDDGKVIGDYTREIDLVNNKAESSYFKIYNKNQGGGVGKQLLAANVAMYQSLGLSQVDVHANIDVGGYAWARYGYVPDDDSWSSLSDSLRERLDEMSGGGRPDEWDAMSNDAQREARDTWMEETFEEFHDSEVDSWRNSDAPLDQTKIELAEKFTEQSEFAITHWAWKAVQNARGDYPPDSKEPMTVTNDEILANTTITYESDGEGRNDPVITVEEIEGLTENQRYSVEKALMTQFNYRAEMDKDNIEPPEHLADNAREYQKDTWNDKSDSDKFEYAESNDLLGEGEGSGEIDSDEADSIRELLDSSDPKAIWTIADSTHGKELLLGSDWEGTIDFSDSETMDRFHAYVGKK